MANNRVLLVVLAGLVLLMALIALFFDPADETAPPEPVAAPAAVHDAGAIATRAAPTAVTLATVKGKAFVRRGGGGEWLPIAAGESLSANDAIRTDPGAEVELSTGDHVVRVVAGTEVAVGELTADLTSFLLTHGLLGAEARGEDGRVLEVRAAGTDAVARASSGRFRMSSNGEGTVAVGSLAGEVRVSGGGASVVLKPGERTVVLPNQKPDAPKPLASSLLLKVAWPEQKTTNQRVITVTGRTDAGALVFALGERVPVAADGTFAAKVRLREGSNRLRLEAMDVSGNGADDEGRVVVNTRGASSRFKTDDLWRQ